MIYYITKIFQFICLYTSQIWNKYFDDDFNKISHPKTFKRFTDNPNIKN